MTQDCNWCFTCSATANVNELHFALSSTLLPSLVLLLLCFRSSLAANITRAHVQTATCLCQPSLISCARSPWLFKEHAESRCQNFTAILRKRSGFDQPDLSSERGLAAVRATRRVGATIAVVVVVVVVFMIGRYRN